MYEADKHKIFRPEGPGAKISPGQADFPLLTQPHLSVHREAGASTQSKRGDMTPSSLEKTQ